MTDRELYVSVFNVALAEACANVRAGKVITVDDKNVTVDVWAALVATKILEVAPKEVRSRRR